VLPDNLGPAAPPVPDSSWQAPQKQVDLKPPEPMYPFPAPPGDKQQPNTPPAGGGESDPLLNPSAPAAPAAPGTNLPSGIAQFADAQEGVAAGLRPMSDGGLDWLKGKGFKTVLHIKRPGHDDATDRKEVEKRGLTYLSLEVSPETLNAKVVEDFAGIVSDKNNYPLFVYDKDGSLAGGLWYLYFRQFDEENVARIRANALGLRMDTEGPHFEMWLAIQKFLGDKGP
jgi:protein tyrosine phosphatase (PTP) superfamily phosphohydrolase (DUF442 family)